MNGEVTGGVGARSILHVDMDAFFASVEVLDDPSLAGKAVLVGGKGARAVVAAASYEARRYGCHSAQPMAQALRMCPQAVVVEPHFRRYREVSNKVFAIFERFTPVIEPLSIDEAFLDLTGTEKVNGDAVSVARRIKDAIRRETGLTGSVGVAANKFLAKLASDMEKPDGLTVLRMEDVERVLGPMPVGRLWGVGSKTAAKLAAVGIKTIGDLRRKSVRWLEDVAGVDAEHYLNLANGVDDRPVTPDRQAKSIGQEETFGTDLADPEEVKGVMLEQCEQVSRRLRKHGLRAGSVTVKIRFGDFQTVTRQTTLREPAETTQPIWEAARGLFEEWCRQGFQPVRLIGVTGGKLGEQTQMELFGNPVTEKQKRLDEAVDRIQERFGGKGIHRGRGGLGNG